MPKAGWHLVISLEKQVRLKVVHHACPRVSEHLSVRTEIALWLHWYDESPEPPAHPLRLTPPLQTITQTLTEIDKTALELAFHGYPTPYTAKNLKDKTLLPWPDHPRSELDSKATQYLRRGRGLLC
jgi:hypothetical protein